MKKRILIISDLHCGHEAGLTPPSKHDRPAPGSNKRRKALFNIRKALYSIFFNEVHALGKLDLLIVNGDCIEGKGERSGSTELITADREEQAAMAAEIINAIKVKKVIMTYGTPSHTGQLEDFENMTRDLVIEKGQDVSLKSHAYIDVNGVVFDCKHKIGSSGIPHGRYTAGAKEDLWNSLWAEHKIVPRSDVFIRSHVHYYGFSGDAMRVRMTTPALQGLGSKYGSRQCSGIVNWGFVYFDVDDKGDYRWQAVLPKEANKLQKITPILA